MTNVYVYKDCVRYLFIHSLASITSLLTRSHTALQWKGVAWKKFSISSSYGLKVTSVIFVDFQKPLISGVLLHPISSLKLRKNQKSTMKNRCIMT